MKHYSLCSQKLNEGTSRLSLQCRCPVKKKIDLDEPTLFKISCIWNGCLNLSGVTLFLAGYLQCMKLNCVWVSHVWSILCPQVDTLEEAESQRKTEEEVTEPQPMVFGRFTEGHTIVVMSCSTYICLCLSAFDEKKMADGIEIQNELMCADWVSKAYCMSGNIHVFPCFLQTNSNQTLRADLLFPFIILC